MKKITMFILGSCPYCKEAFRLMDTLYTENPAYKSLEIDIIDEYLHPEISERYDYSYVPTYYVNGEKLHDGAATLEKIRRVFDAAMGEIK